MPSKIISCKVIIETPWGILLVRDAIDKAQRYALPGGNWEQKDGKYFKAAVRELKEELGLIVKWRKIRQLYEFPGSPVHGRQRRVYIYIAQVKNHRLHPVLAREHFSKEISGIAFLGGSRRIDPSLLQGHVQQVIKIYLKPGRGMLREIFMSPILIEDALTTGWHKVL
jgi:8-oxo-dGTP pyrophosphatase MutT (NUDIX family)